MSTGKTIISLAEIKAQQCLLRARAVEGMVLEVAAPEEARMIVSLKSTDGTSF